MDAPLRLLDSGKQEIGVPNVLHLEYLPWGRGREGRKQAFGRVENGCVAVFI